MILLDTCALLWLVSDYTQLSSAAIKEIKSTNQLVLSPISALEIAIKCKNGKLKLPTAQPFEWYNECLTFWHLTELELKSETLISSALLPPIHKDPFDRIIIATALEHNATIITADETISQYPDIRTTW